MAFPPYVPPLLLRNGLAMTLYAAFASRRRWETRIGLPAPDYRECHFRGAGGVPLYGWVAVPAAARGTWVATYGITGSLEDQWVLHVLGRKAFAAGYAVVLFDWRAHGKTATLSPTLTSDGLYEGEDFVCIAAAAKQLACPPPFWFAGYSLGGQLALWGAKAANTVAPATHAGLSNADIGGAIAICPSLESARSLRYLMQDPLGRILDRRIARALADLARDLHAAHPEAIDLAAIARAKTIWGFDREFVIGPLGFSSVEAYYQASSPLYMLPEIAKPTLIVYAADDPMFDPTLVPDLQGACDRNTAIELLLTAHGGHVGYLSSRAGQRTCGDPDPWWAWNRALEWCDGRP